MTRRSDGRQDLNLMFHIPGLVGLETLDLSYNSISEVDPEAFLHLRSLSYLCLAKNSLTMVGPDWPAPLMVSMVFCRGV